MAKGKRLYLGIILTIILYLGIWSAVLDFSRFQNLNFEYDIYPGAILKRINVILSAIIAWSAGKDGLSSRDGRKMKAVFLFACFAEGAFVFRLRDAGICFFAVCQTLLIVRNSNGLRYKLIHSNLKQKKLLLISGLVIFSVLASSPIIFSSLIKIHGPIFLVYLYEMLLCASMWTGLANNILGLFPKRNSRMAVFGILCFFCCDVSVGLDAVLEAGAPWLAANSLIWIFYIPALVLLALSCYK